MPVMHRWFLLALCLLLGACAAQRGNRAPSVLPRAAPDYMQWLERQSMLGAAPQLTGLVSGTETLLRAPSVDAAGSATRGDRVDTLLEAADTWLWVHPPTLLTASMRPVWVELAAAQDLPDALGLRGLYVAPAAESGSVWEYDRRQSETGEDVTSLFFAPHMGTDAQFAEFAALAARRQWQLGADIVPPATGMGPDFFLSARLVRDYPGIYMMVEVPEALWAAMPAAASPWEGAALDAAQMAALVEKGGLPPALARDNLPWAEPGGWAVTGEIRGNDGRSRRWAYRYSGNPRRPVLWWDDPSGGARRIFSASVIRQIGVLQQTLAGLRVEPLAGLDAVDGAHGQAASTLEPAPSALRDITREVRRYGGWSVQLDGLPASLAPAMQRAGADFTADTVTAPAAEYALLTGDAGPLRAALAASLEAGVEQRRLLRRLPAVEGVDVRTLQDAPQTMAVLRAHLGRQAAWGQLLSEGPAPRLYATAATLAAMSAGLTPQTVVQPGAEVEIRRRHLLLTFFRSGLPGLFFVSGQDLAGVLSLPEGPAAQRTRGAWGLNPATAAQFSTRQGTPRAPVAYAPVAEQLKTPGSYAHTLSKGNAVRRRYGLARGTVTGVARTSHAGSVGVFARLPAHTAGQGSFLLLLANFSGASVVENVTLPLGVRGQARDILYEGLQNQQEQQALGKDENPSADGLRVELAPWQCRWLLFGGTGVPEAGR